MNYFSLNLTVFKQRDQNYFSFLFTKTNFFWPAEVNQLDYKLPT